MVQAAVASSPEFGVSDIEMQSDRLSYTVDTLELLQKQAGPDTRLYLILGEDNLYDLPNWRNPRRIVAQAHILVARRADRPVRALPAYLDDVVTVCESPEIAISSTMIRARIQQNRSIRHLVPVAVEQYIREHHLYAEADQGPPDPQSTGRQTGCANARPH
jgi:nicotinate-nucleotide adenylyltransferase